MKKIFLTIILVACSVMAPFYFSQAAAPADSDKDGLSDELELKFKTDKDNPDSDADGFKDGEEVDWGYSPASDLADKIPQEIEIDLKNQKLYYVVDNVKWKEFKVSTGKKSMPTPKGEFKVVNKINKAWSKTYGLWMPNWMGLDRGGIGIHELPIWPSGYREGENHLGTPVSHGCIRLSVKDSSYLFERVPVGISVKIY